MSSSWDVAGISKGALYNNNYQSCAQKGSIGSNNNHLSGSFCAQYNGTYTFRLIGRQTTSVEKLGDFSVSGWEGGYTARCLGSNNQDDRSFTLKSNNCYPWKVWAKYWCLFQSSHIEFQVMGPGDSSFRQICQGDSLANFGYSDCVDGFYGQECFGDCAYTYCNGYGSCNDKRSGNGYCTCTSFSPPFCEDPNTNYFDVKPKIEEYKPDFSMKETKEIRMTSNPMFLEEFVYSGVVVSGRIQIPQNGQYAFRVIGTHEAQLIINGNTIGSYGDMYACEERSRDKITGEATIQLPRGPTSFQVKIVAGCALYPQSFEIQWKNYRQNYDNPSTEWSTIPIRYLGE